MVAPKGFVSHSSEDRLSVKVLAERLRENGVDAWYDEWEIGPGDSFVKR